ncbi:AMP-binding protein [Allokutzneria albata]|uniref:Amino acid adenylation domain-containing protein n=1 Tax=Allokutzneria albata TaxID=211114 RepID=A0A1G9VAR7_ALLAB|nr:AMP-binding protein [Allokutzneria albata]SDM69183.1 amino acid adenylation domain-containing protein [Allokutzneria albata]
MSLTPHQVRADIAEFLLMEPEELADDLDLYDAGLDSVRMLTIVDRWREYGVDVSFAELMEKPTVADWWSMLSVSRERSRTQQELTPAQQGILAAQLLDPVSPAYNTGEYVEIRGPIDSGVFERALQHVMEDIGGPQWTFQEGQFSAEDALEWMRRDLATPVDIESGPLFGHALFQVDDETFLWYHRVHHIALDGYGVAIVARRIAEVYSALVEGRTPAPHRFGTPADIVEPVTDSRQYWLDYLEDCPPAVSFADGTGLPSRHFHRVRARAEAKSDLVVAAVAAYLSHMSGTEEVVLGLPVLNRPDSAALSVPCTVLNAIPLRLRVDTDDLAVLAGRAAQDLRRSLPHQHYRFEQLRRDIGLHKRLFGPVVNVMPFDYDFTFAGAECQAHNLSAGPVEDIAVNVYDRRDGAGIEVVIDGNPDRYSVEDLERHLDGVLGFLGGQRSVLDGGPLPAVRSVAELIREQDPQAVAIECGDQRLTYGELVAATEPVVQVKPTRDVDTVAKIVGAVLSGSAYVPFEEALPDIDFDDPAYVIQTSGSTGRPRSVVIGHSALNAFVAAAIERYDLRATDRVLQFAPLNFDASVEEIFPVLCVGGTLVLRTEAMTESPQALLRACAERRITVLDLPTAYWHELAFAMPPLPGSLRTVIIGGEAALPERVERWHRAQPHARLINTYGPTEATVVATAADLVDGGGVPIGRPLSGVRAIVADADGKPLPVGVPGELWLAGAGLALGYLGEPELTAERFRDLDGERAYRTGDRVRLGRDGQLYHLGRFDDEIKISGHRVSPAAVEAVLSRHPAVRAAMVTAQARPDGTKVLAAQVVTDLRDHLRDHLPAAVVPSVIELVDALPRNRSGKLDRASANHGTVLGIMRHVLGRPDLSTEDDFFESGGQSLQTIQVANRVGAALGVEVPATLVFQHPTAGGLARALEGREERSDGSVEADAVLDRDILPGPAGERSGRILLTGATGFVGRHLLAELREATDAEIICLARPDYDLTKPWLGLDAARWQDLARVDAIYHCAAEVSLLRGYGSVRAVNVEGTRSLLRLAAARAPSRFHYVSTVSVLGEHRTGYQQSKWVAEQLVLEAGRRGLDTTIHRLGRVAGPTLNPHDVLWQLLLKGIPAGVVPRLHHAEPWADAREVAREILAQHGGVHAVLPQSRIVFDDLYAWIADYGYPVEVCSRAEWRARTTDLDPATLALLDLWSDSDATSEEKSTVDRAAVHRLLDHCVAAGLLPAAN